MQRTVDGEDWQPRGWISVVRVLYDTDVTIELRHASDGEDGYVTIENLSNNSVLLTKTDLSVDQAIYELNLLENKGLVDYQQPFEDTDFVICRLTTKGFEVAHSLQKMDAESKWQSSSSKINLTLTIATILLAATATVQALEGYQNGQLWKILVLTLVGSVLMTFVIGRKEGRGPDVW